LFRKLWHGEPRLMMQSLLLFLASFAVYFNCIVSGTFVFDDHLLIEGNPSIRSLENITSMFFTNMWGFGSGWVSNYYRPFIHVLHTITYAFFGLHPSAFHALNVTMHGLASLSVFFLIRGIMSNGIVDKSNASFFSGPFVASLLFALHPIHTEAVAWASGINEVSYCLFYVTSLYLYSKYKSGQSSHTVYYLFSLLCFLCSLFSKEQAITFPIILVSYDLLLIKEPFSKARIRRLVLEYGGYAVVLVIYFLLRFSALGFVIPRTSTGQGQLHISAWQSVISVFPLFMTYIEKLFFPANLSAWYVNSYGSLYDPTVLLSLLFFVLFLLFSIVAYRKNRIAFFGLLLIVVPLTPVLYVKALQGATMAERYLYLPSVGLSLLVAVSFEWTMSHALRWRRLINAFLIMILFIFATGTFERNFVWKDDYNLWADTVKKAPGAALAHNGYGAALASRGRYDEAIKEYFKVLSLHEDYQVHNNLGLLYEETNQLGNAVAQYNLAIRINPLCADCYYNLGIAFERQGLLERAEQEYRMAIKIKPDADAYSRLGDIYFHQRKKKEAIDAYRAALSLNPEMKDAATRLRLLGEGS
jgi:tetratricopeptide (TPR) repeat protein